MIYFKLNGTGDEIAYDDESMTYPEGLELEKQTGLGANLYMAELGQGTTRSTAAALWLGVVHTAAVRDQVSFRDAAKANPFDQFTETVDLMASMKSARREAKAPPLDPTDPTASGSPEPTSPGTSEPQPGASPSPSGDATTSAPSPSASASAPGSGTS